MSFAHSPSKPNLVDPTAHRLRPLTEEQRQARSEALRRALEMMDALADETDTDEVWEEVMRGIDETRPHRPLFEGMY